MKAILVKGAGAAEDLYIGEIPTPKLTAESVKIQVRASALNRADTLQRKGLYPAPDGQSPILGIEVSGTIIEKGKKVTGFECGDRIMTLVEGGGYGEEVVVPAGLLMKLPDNLDFFEGAAIPEAFITAHHNLFHLGNAKRAKAVLVHAGASGVGTAAIQLLVGEKRRVFVTVGTLAKAKFCASLGAEPILYHEMDFSKTILEKTDGRGVELLLDCVGANYLDKNLEALGVEGTLILIGLLGGRIAKVDLAKVLLKRTRVIGSTLRPLALKTKFEIVERFRAHALESFSAKTLKPVVDSIFPVAEASKAHQRMEANLNMGKILLEWPQKA